MSTDRDPSASETGLPAGARRDRPLTRQIGLDEFGRREQGAVDELAQRLMRYRDSLLVADAQAALNGMGC